MEMQTTVRLEIRDGEKRIDLELSGASEFEKIATIGGLFAYLGVGGELREMIETYRRTGEAYRALFEQVQPEEPRSLHPSATAPVLKLHNAEKTGPLRVDAAAIAYAAAAKEKGAENDQKGDSPEDKKDESVILEQNPSPMISRPRRLPIVNVSENPLVTPISERVNAEALHLLENHEDRPENRAEQPEAGAEQPQEQSSRYTGIKQTERGPTYQCYYRCPCGNKGRIYIPKDRKTVKCGADGQILKVRPATPFKDPKTGLPARDQWGNFYFADEPAEGEER